MSTTATPKSSCRTAIDSDDDFDGDDFDDLLFKNPTVCSRCYRTVRERYGPTEEHQRRVRIADGHRCEDMDPYGERRVYRPCTYCSECGSQSARAEDDVILTQCEASHVAANIAFQLQHRGIDAAIGVIQYVTSKLKAKPELQGRDTDIFRVAAKLAVKYPEGTVRGGL